MVYAAANFLNRGLAFLLVPIYTRYLSPADYGVVSLAETLGAVVATIAAIGLPAWVLRVYFEHPEGTPEHVRTVATVIKGSAAIFSASVAASFLLGPPAMQWLLPQFSVPFFPCVALAIVAAVAGVLLQMPTNVLRLQERAAAFAVVSVGQVVLTAGCALLLVAALRLGAVGMLVAKVLAAGVALVFGVFLTRKYLRGWERGYLPKALAASAPLIPQQLVSLVLTSGDRLVLERFRSPAEVGLYSLGYTMGMAMNAVTLTALLAWQPLFLRLAREGEGGKITIVRFAAPVMWALAAVATVGTLIARPIAKWLVSPVYAPAAAVVPVVIGAYLLHGIGSMFQLSMLHSGKTRLAAGIVTFAAAANIGLNVLLVPRLGYMVCAWTTVLAFGIQAVGFWWLGDRLYPIPYSVPRIAAWILAYGVALFGTQVPATETARHLWLIVTATISLGLLWILKGMKLRALLEAKHA